MKNNRILGLLTASALLLSVFTACDSNTDDPVQDPTDGVTTTTAADDGASTTTDDSATTDTTGSGTAATGSTATADQTTRTTTTTTRTTTTTTAVTVSEYDTEFLKFREGLSNTYACLTKKKKLTVAYIGGSITAGSAATDSSTLSYRALTTAWLRKTFPDAEITEINMGTGSAGSKFAAYYADVDVAPKKPDLVFLECAINDFLESRVITTQDVSIQYETIIRKLRATNPACEFVALYTTNDEIDISQEYFAMAKAQDDIAAHYGIPSINIGRRLRVEKKMTNAKVGGNYTAMWKVYFHDSVHPTNAGHALYSDYITEFLQQAFDEAAKGTVSVKSKNTPAAKNSTLLMNTTYIKTTNVDLSKSTNWKHATGQSYGTTENYIYTDNADNELVITFTGTTLHFNCSGLRWDDTVRASYSVDGGDWVVLGPNAIREVQIVSGLTYGTHTIRFKAGDVTAQKVFKVGAFMII